MKRKKHLLKVIFFLLSIFLLYKSSNNIAYAAEKAEQRELRVLVIEINPYLETKGMRVTDFFNTYWGDDQYYDKSIQEVEDDIEYASNNVIKFKIVGHEYLNEFPTYTQEFTLSHYDYSQGKRVYTGKGYRLDEATYLDMFGNGWYGWWSTDNPVMGEGIDSYPFKYDYNYLIDKFDLVNRRNNNEFDMVYVVTIDPTSMGEINMVGRNAFNVNGVTIYGNCDNFLITGCAYARRDTSLEVIGHLAESMLNYVYQVNDESYNSPLVFNDISELNTWQQFYLCKDKAPANCNVYGVGQVHYAPNSTSAYDWANLTTVQSTWEDWKYNYPNLTGKTTAFNSSVYDDGTMPTDRAHSRWWFSLMPHYQGRDVNGYSYNWWDYIFASDYVVSIEPYDTYTETNLVDNSKNIIMEKGKKLPDLKFRLSYRSGKEKDFVIDDMYNFVNIEDPNIITVEDGEIKALEEGKTKLTLNYDGRSASYDICVVDNKFSLYFNDCTVSPDSTSLYCNGSVNNTTNIAVSAPSDFAYSISYSSENDSIAQVSDAGIVTAIGSGTTYIITEITIDNLSKEFKTKITCKEASIVITASKDTLKIGEQFTFKAKAYGLTGSLTWSVSNSKILLINPKTGKITAKKAGTAYVIVKNGTFSRKFKVTVI